MNLFCSPTVPEVKEDRTSSVFECDYDKGATTLYQAIESQAWVPVLNFLETGKWDHMFRKDPKPPARQVQTWVTRFETDGSVRWSHLPIHAAIIFKAPRKIIATLLDMYGIGARCTDDQQMLPIHLAFKHGADDSIVTLLLQRFPEGLFTKNVRGRVPTDIEGPNKEKMEMIRAIVKVTTESVSTKQSEFYQEKSRDIEEDLQLQKRLNESLESEKKELEEKLSRLQAEAVILKNENELLKQKDPSPDLEQRILRKSASDLDASIARSLTRSHRRGVDPDVAIRKNASMDSRRDRYSHPYNSALRGTRSKDISMSALGRSYSEARSEKDSTTAIRDAYSEDLSRDQGTPSLMDRTKKRKKKKKRRSKSASEPDTAPYLGYRSSISDAQYLSQPAFRSTPRRTHGFFQGFGGTCE